MSGCVGADETKPTREVSFAASGCNDQRRTRNV
jgi:hypothetical protein